MKKRIAAFVPLLGIAMAGALAADGPKGFHPNSWGYDVSAIDNSVEPGNDFDGYANGAWKARVTIPADRAGWTIGSISQEQTLAQLRSIMEQTATSNAAARPSTTTGKIGAFYASYMDQAKIDALGTKPMADDLTAIEKARTRNDLATLMGGNVDGFQGSILAISVACFRRRSRRRIGASRSAWCDCGHHRARAHQDRNDSARR